MLIPLLLLTAIALSFYAGLVKISAHILHFKVTWKSCFLFAFMMLVVILVSRRVSPPADHTLPVVIGQMLAMAIGFAGLGSWFFRKRITDADGRISGWPGSIRLSALALSFIFGFGLAVVIAVYAFSSYASAQP
jgi:hypothetical protein